MPKICFLSLGAYSLFNPKTKYNFGGAELQSFLYATHLAKKKKYQVSFIVADHQQSKKETIMNVNVIRSVRIRHSLNPIDFLMWPLKIFQACITANSDVYIQRSAGVETAIVATYCYIFRKKFIYMVASTIDVDKSYQKQHKYIGQLYSLAIKSANSIIVQTEEQKQLLLQNYHKDSKLIHNSFPTPKQSPVNKRKFILWVGSSQELKRPDMFLTIAKAIKYEKFIMIMPVNNAKLWNKVVSATRIIPNLKVVKHVPFHKMGYYYSQAKIVINTSTVEGFPNTFVQSAANKTPIASLSINPDGFITKNRCGITGNDNLGIFIKKIKKILENRKKYRDIQNNSFQYFLKYHCINNNISILEKIID